MLRKYEQIEQGKRVVSCDARELGALKVWLWRHGYSWKTNVNGKVANVLIEQKK